MTEVFLAGLLSSVGDPEPPKEPPAPPPIVRPAEPLPPAPGLTIVVPPDPLLPKQEPRMQARTNRVVWQLADASGKLWKHENKGWLEQFVAQENAKIEAARRVPYVQPPRTFMSPAPGFGYPVQTYPVMPMQSFGLGCAGGRCR